MVGSNRYVRSPTSNGWINEEDLPVEKYCAMHDRIKRERAAVGGRMRRASAVDGLSLAQVRI